MSDENKLIVQRREKLQAMREQGVAFPNQFRPDALAQPLHEAYDSMDAPTIAAAEHAVKVAGRIMLKRVMGKNSFVHIQDMSGQIQLFLQRDILPEGVYQAFKKWDIGDIIAVEGTMFKTQKNELSVRASAVTLLTKSLRPLPEKWQGLKDQETCYRQRYVDLIMSKKSRDVFKVRTQVVSYIRNYLDQAGFMEVETPMMHVIPGGATAKPFVTQHNALDMALYLRIAPELYLKRLVVGGFERVYEINRSFRNEGLSTRHNPEFTMLEFYESYADYHDLMDRTEALLRGMLKTLLQQETVVYQGETYDFSESFARITVVESILSHNDDLSVADMHDKEKLKAKMAQLHLPVKETYGLGKMQIEIFEKTVEHTLKRPTFITEYPAEVSPLARRNDDNPFVTDRFEFFVGGREIANGFSELNDPEDQAARFLQQVEEKEAGDDEAMHYDADYIRALEYGMPPTAGEGIGIDRLVMLLTDSPSIRDVLLFPHMRSE